MDKIEWGAGTAGPWVYNTGPSLSGRYHTVEQADDNAEHMICECYEGSEAQQEANARAIAEVPAMVQALRGLNESWSELFPDGPDGEYGIVSIADEHAVMWRNFRAILARIDGEE